MDIINSTTFVSFSFLCLFVEVEVCPDEVSVEFEICPDKVSLWNLRFVQMGFL